MRWLVALLMLALAAPVAAQSTTFRWIPGQEIVLAADIREGLSIGFEPGEQVARISMENDTAFDLEVSTDRESVLARPASSDANAQLDIFTDRRFYRFRLTALSGPGAMTLATLEPEAPLSAPVVELEAEVPQVWSYRISGDGAVSPVDVSDNGVQTTITYDADQPLPAVFAIGPTGDEEVVDGHMRDGVFVIDRVHRELVFRIDRNEAHARRNPKPEEAD